MGLQGQKWKITLDPNNMAASSTNEGGFLLSCSSLCLIFGSGYSHAAPFKMHYVGFREFKVEHKRWKIPSVKVVEGYELTGELQNRRVVIFSMAILNDFLKI